MDAPSVTANDASGRRVLVVEDDYFIAEDIRRTLETNGVQVLGPVASVDDALKVIETNETIDAAVLDINLSDVMVFPVADALKTRGVPFVFATGYEKTAIPARFLDVEHRHKPVDFDAIKTIFAG